MVDFSDLQGFAFFISFLCLCWSSYVDLKKFILPDLLTLVVFLMGLLVAIADPLHVDLMGALIGAAVGYGASWGLRWAVYYIKKQEALGLGDVKLFAAAGVWVGAEGVVSVAFYGSLITLVVVLLKWALTRRGSLHDIVPFGPGIALGLVITTLFGPLSRFFQIVF